MSKKISPLKAVVIVVCSLIGAFVILVIAVMIINPEPSERTLQRRKEKRESDSIKSLTANLPDTVGKESPTSKQETHTLTEEDYIKYFQDAWDSVKLEKDDFSRFYKYGKYTEDLSKINQQMSNVVESNPNFKKLEKLRLKFGGSSKMKKADNDWLTYGEPKMEYDITEPCENYIRTNAHDPGSIDITDSKITQISKGWKVQLKYRGKNAFGAKVLNTATFEVRFNPVSETFYAHSVR